MEKDEERYWFSEENRNYDRRSGFNGFTARENMCLLASYNHNKQNQLCVGKGR